MFFLNNQAKKMFGYPNWLGDVQIVTYVNCQGRAIIAPNKIKPYNLAKQFWSGSNSNDSLNTQNSF